MEAPTGCIPTQFDSLQSIHINECNTTQLDIMVPIFTATIMRLRGGAGDANKDSKFNDIPYLTNINFKWNGLPTFDFDEKILFPLQNGLGSIALHKATLLDTALQKDPGGLLGVPTTGAAPSNTLDEHNQRVRKLFCCLMNYIDARAEIYKYFMRKLNGEGIVCYNIILTFNIPVPSRMVRARVDSWNRMSMDSLRIPYSIDGLFKWVELVSGQARLLSYDGIKQREKFIAGLPSFFDPEKAQMGKDTVSMFPATYGLLPGHAAANNAATAHPNAGEPNIESLARRYLGEWCNKISTVHQHAPSGMVRSVECANICLSDVINLLADDVTLQTKCFVCGGIGHAASCTLDDGTVLTCPNKVLHGKSAKTVQNGDDKQYAKQISSMEKDIENLNAIISDLETELANKVTISTKSRANRYSRDYKSNRSKQSSANATESDQDHYSEEEEEEESRSDDSAHSSVSIGTFANAIQRDQKKPVRRFIKRS